jgi:hypothetical protein
LEWSKNSGDQERGGEFGIGHTPTLYIIIIIIIIYLTAIGF